MSPQAGSKGRCDGRIDAKELLALLGRDLQQVEDQLAAVGGSIASPLTENIAEAAEELRASVGAFLEKAHAATDAVGGGGTHESTCSCAGYSTFPLAHAGLAGTELAPARSLIGKGDYA